MVNSLLNDTNIPSKNIYIKSSQADHSYSDTHKIFRLQQSINSTRPDIQNLISIVGFEMPNSFYLINSSNNILVIKSINPTLTITIPVGNYDVYSLMNEINSNQDFINRNYLLEFNNNTNKYTLSSTTGANFTISNQSTIYKIVGLDGSTTSSSSSIEFPNCVNLAGVGAVLIKLIDLGIQNLDGNGVVSDTLAKVNIDVISGGIISYKQEAENIFSIIDSDIINKLEVKITDEDGVDFDLNGGEFSLVLCLHSVYKRDERFLNKYYLDKVDQLPVNLEKEK